MLQHHIFVLRHRAKLAVSNGDILFTNSHGILERIPTSRVSAITVCDTARVSFYTLCLLLRMGVAITFVSANGQPFARALPA